MRKLLKQLTRLFLIVITIMAVYKIIWSGLDSESENVKSVKTQSLNNLEPDSTKRKQVQGDNMTFIEERNKMRIAQVTKTCNALKNETGRRNNSQPIVRTVMNPNRDIMWCRVNKAASTYTFAMLKTLFNSSIHQMQDTAKEVSQLPYTDMRKIIEKSYKFTFVREPFQRLFSTYCNKFYFPKDHWAPIGPKVVKRYRHRPSTDSLIYGHNITFHEMIKFTVEEYEAGRHLDEHLRPMNERCYPCDYQYDFIGKLETMVSDWTYLIYEWSRTKQINLPKGAGEKRIHFGETNHMLDTFVVIKDSTISKYNLYLRAWSYYKIVGYIYRHFDMPFRENSEIKFKIFQNALEEAAKKSKPYAEETKRQKTEALKQAYASVPLALLERLKKVVALDCMLYGYDNNPDWVFDREDIEADFNYFQGLE